MTNNTAWTVVRVIVAIMIVLTFTPLLTPQGKFQPEFLGMPYTLWINIVSALVLVVLTWIGTRVHPGRNE